MADGSDTERHFRNCPLCEAGCGLEIAIDRGDQSIVSIRGDALDPVSKGYICPKSQALGGLRRDPDRLRRPLRRRGKDFEEIGWDEAIAEAGERLRHVQARHGAESIGYYFGNPTAHRPGLALYLPAMLGALATRQIYWVGPVDQAPKMMASALMYGSAWSVSLPDIDRTDHLIVIGANPVVSNGSVLIAPGLGRRIEAVRSRGGKVVVIDPRRSETAAIADEYVAVRPGSDALLLMAMVATLFEEGLVDPGRLAPWISRLEILRDIAAGFPPEAVVEATGVAAATIRRLAREFAAAPRSTIYGRTGTCTQAFGSICNWLIEALQILTGNLDTAGGAMFSPGAILSPGTLPQPGVIPAGRWHSRVAGLPEFMGFMPAAALADEMLVPGPGQMRGFVSQASNPVLSYPNGARIAEGFAGLEAMVSLDIYVNETSRFADIILPGRDYLEEADFPAVTSYSMIRNYVKWAAPAFAAEGVIPSDARIMTELAAAIRDVPPEQVEQELVDQLLHAAQALGRAECRDVAIDDMRASLVAAPGADRIYEIMLRAGPYGDAFGRVAEGVNLATLKAKPHGIDFGPLTEQMPGMIATADGRIDLAPQLLVDDVERLKKERDTAVKPSAMLLIGRRDIRSKNSWLHNVPALAKGKLRCTLMVNGDDAIRLGLADGEMARLSSGVATLSVPVAISAEMMPGVVSLPHGWGHGGEGTVQRVAGERPGVNANALIDERLLDVPSATSVLNGIRVSVERAL